VFPASAAHRTDDRLDDTPVHARAPRILSELRSLLLRLRAFVPAEPELLAEVDAAVAGLADRRLTSGEAAELLGVKSLNTVKSWARAGMFPGAIRTETGRWLIPYDDVWRVRENMASIAAISDKRRRALPDNDVSLMDEPPEL
jgi:hypothetical protein